MGRLIQVALDGGLVGAHGRKHSRGGFARGRHQRFDQPPRLRGIQQDALARFESTSQFRSFKKGETRSFAKQAGADCVKNRSRDCVQRLMIR